MMTRSLPQTFRGGQITSSEISGLTLYGGQFRANSPRNDTSMDDMFMNGKTAFTSDRFNFGGSEYAFNDKRTQVGVWYAQLSDIYQQQYFNLSHSQPIGDWTLGALLGYFIGKERSWQLRHDYNFVALGIPGLTMMNRYISGDNRHKYCQILHLKQKLDLSLHYHPLKPPRAYALSNI